MQNAIYSLGSENRTAGTKNVEHLEESSHTENNVYVATGPAGQFCLTQQKATRTRASQCSEGCTREQVSESRIEEMDTMSITLYLDGYAERATSVTVRIMGNFNHSQQVELTKSKPAESYLPSIHW